MRYQSDMILALVTLLAVAPGEHPRLFFHKNDVPALRNKAGTPEGQAVVRRLRFLLNGSDGETMPAQKRPTDAAFGDKSNEIELPDGAYSISHAAGFGMLYQLTGDKKYAGLAKQCFEWAFAGVRDRDGKGRYSWKEPSGALRAGPSVGWYAVAYDLCYDGWDAEFRQRVARAILDYEKGTPHCNLDDLARGKRQHPGSNHWGAEVGGASLALLAIRGDPGVDAKRVEELLAANEKCIERQLTTGWGDHGWFAEGDGCGAISSDTAFVPALQAWRKAAGKDFITTMPNGQWMTLKWLMLTQIVPNPTKNNFPHRGTYDHNVWSRRGLSGSGTFAQGFGAIADEFKPALLWMYNRTFKAADDKAGAPCDTVSPYPHRAVLALINWPFGLAEKNPGEVLPRAVEDKAAGYYMFRNRWADAGDIIVTALMRGSRGNYSVPGGDIMVWGLGQKTKFPVRVTGATKDFRATKTGGSFNTSLGGFAVDFSDNDALLVLTGPVQGVAQGVVEAGGTKFTVMTLQKGAAPEPKADGDKVVVGKRTLSVVNGQLNVKGRTMIIDRLENAGLYSGLGERIALALASLKTKREVGRHELDGDKVFALVQQYQTKPLAEGKWESHRKYIDVQYVEEGVERIGWTPVAGLTVTEPYDEAKDIAFYQGDGDFVTVPAGSFVILFPDDAHMPGIAVDKPSPVKKVVVKVRVP